MRSTSLQEKTKLSWEYSETDRPTSLTSSPLSPVIIKSVKGMTSVTSSQRSIPTSLFSVNDRNILLQSSACMSRESSPIVISSDEEEVAENVENEQQSPGEDSPVTRQRAAVDRTSALFSLTTRAISAIPEITLRQLLTNREVHGVQSLGLIQESVLEQMGEQRRPSSSENEEIENDDDNNEAINTDIKKPYNYWRKLFENKLIELKIINNDHYEFMLRKDTNIQRLQVKIKMNELEKPYGLVGDFPINKTSVFTSLFYMDVT